MAAKAPNAEKGARYLASLDQALCSGSWSDVPELARKVEKHAPSRNCLTLAARSEAQIASASHRPTSASSTPAGSIHGLSELVPKLEEAVAVGNSVEEDAFVAGVCLAEIHWLREDHGAALKALPDHVPQANAHSSIPSALGWMEICGVKTTYIRAAALESQGKEAEARELYQQAITRTPGSRTPELRRWTERMLARSCMYYHGQTSFKSIQTLSESIRAFGAWSDFWQRSPSSPRTSGSSLSRVDLPRRQIWRAYYDLLSMILQYGLTYQISPSHAAGVFVGPPESFPEASYTSIRKKQRADLKRVEATYESLLIEETQFPKAIQTNREVEEWVEQAMRNWRIICGSGWTDSELGEGGKESVSRSVLEILYRAATKTFHSTAVLRDLMYVHAAVGEFDLALHAFDSYVEIVSRGKARAEKTGEHELGFDDDDTAVLTAVEAVRMLCRYGDREQAEKALEVGKIIQKWLGLERPSSSRQANTQSDDNRAEAEPAPVQSTASTLKSTTLAAAYRAIGMSQASWARLTYEPESRPSLQAEAIKQLQRSQAQDMDDVETAYALALTLAETREINAAIAVLRHILIMKPQPSKGEVSMSDYRRERELLPLWHLLALCLSAKDQHEPAMKMCEAAFEQFGDAAVLFGQGTNNSTEYEKQMPSAQPSRGIVDQMDGLEKESIIQIKMTQLTFVELLEGPSVAVDMTDELLGLYARLFGNPEHAKAVLVPPPTAISTTPSKTGGTLRSIAGSIRPRSNRHSVEKVPPPRPTNGTSLEPPTINGTHDGANGAPIAITVTNEDGRGRHEHRHHHFKFRSSNSGPRSRSRSAAANEKSLPPDTSSAPPLPPPKDLPQTTAPAGTTSGEQATKPHHPLKPMDHNTHPAAWPAPIGHNDQPPTQDTRLPVPHPSASHVPEPRFPSAQQRRHKISLLVEIWLFISSLYVRAENLDDAAAAVEEARRLVEAFEAEVVAEGGASASARGLFLKGWGAGKGVDELWAEVWCGKGDLSSARASPFDAISHYETALSYFPDHPSSMIALSNYLLDIYTEALPAEAPVQLLPSITSLDYNASTPTARVATSSSPAGSRVSKKDPSPAALNRLAARERAYLLLSTLTRLGSGWDDSEAWLGMARCREVGGEVGKAKEALWWVVELEEGRGVRGWEKAGGGTL